MPNPENESRRADTGSGVSGDLARNFALPDDGGADKKADANPAEKDFFAFDFPDEAVPQAQEKAIEADASEPEEPAAEAETAGSADGEDDLLSMLAKTAPVSETKSKKASPEKKDSLLEQLSEFSDPVDESPAVPLVFDPEEPEEEEKPAAGFFGLKFPFGGRKKKEPETELPPEQDDEIPAVVAKWTQLPPEPEKPE